MRNAFALASACAGGVIAASASTPTAPLVGTPIIVFAVLQSTYTSLEPLLTTGDAAALGGGACVAPSSLRLELTLPEPAAAPVGAGAALPRGGVYTLLAVQCHSLDPVPVELSLVLTNPSLGDGHAHLPQSWAPLASVNTVFACAYVVLLFYGLAGCGVPPGKGRPSLTLANTVCWLGVATKLCALSLGAAFYNSYGETGVMGVTRVLADASESVAEGVLLLAMLGVGLGWGVSPTPTPSQRRRECGWGVGVAAALIVGYVSVVYCAVTTPNPFLASAACLPPQMGLSFLRTMIAVLALVGMNYRLLTEAAGLSGSWTPSTPERYGGVHHLLRLRLAFALFSFGVPLLWVLNSAPLGSNDVGVGITTGAVATEGLALWVYSVWVEESGLRGGRPPSVDAAAAVEGMGVWGPAHSTTAP